MDRLTRKELKTDKFALEVGHSVEYVSEHRQQFVRYGSIAAGAIALALIIYGFLSYRAGVREDALRSALRVQEAFVGQPQPGSEDQSFPTQAAKDAALRKALTEVANNYSGSKQAAVARYYLGTMDASNGDLANADKNLRQSASDGGKDYGSLAKLALASVLQAENKAPEGEQLLRSLVENPTTFVSKEQATIALARYIATSKPAEARSMLDKLRTERSAVSRAALTALADIPAAK